MESISKCKFIADKPMFVLDESEELKFGHEEIALTLEKIIMNSPNPFTIGLFGKWGVGKSTIAYYLKGLLKNSKTACVIFDVWKHEGDSLRRTFLKEVLKQLNDYGNGYFNTKYILNERIEGSIQKEVEGPIYIKRDQIKQIWVYGLIILILLFIIGIFANHYGDLNLYFQIIASILLSGGLLGWIFRVVFVTTDKTTTNLDRFVDPHDFEKEFEKLIRNVKNQKIVIVFDNLDRVTHEKSVEVLSTIKTFLEPREDQCTGKSMVFIIPCDEKAIKNHIRSAFNIENNNSASPFDPDEFLRKFFNTIIRIPEFISGELEDYAMKKLKHTGINVLVDNKVAWLLVKAFRDNPRQIVQFVNIILANYLLIKEREGEGKDFPKDYIENNIAQLAKYLILSELFPNEMEIIKERKIINLKGSKIKDIFNESKDENKERAGNFIRFLEQTDSDIPIENIREFLTLRRSEHEKMFPGIEVFISSLQDRNEEQAENYIKQIHSDLKNNVLIEAFSQVIKVELDKISNPVSVSAFIDILLQLLEKYNIKMTDTVYGDIFYILNTQGKAIIHAISPISLNYQILEKYKQYRSGIILQWINILEKYAVEKDSGIDKQFVLNILTVISDKPNYLSKDIEKTIRAIIENVKFSHDYEIIEIIAMSHEIQKRIITPAFTIKCISGIDTKGSIKEALAKIDLLSKFDDSYFEKEVNNAILNKLKDILEAVKNDRSKELIKESEILINKYLEFFDIHKRVIEEAEEEIYNAFVNSLIDIYNLERDTNQKKSYIPILVKLNEYINPSNKMIENVIYAYLRSINVDQIKYVFEKIGNTKEFIKKYENVLLDISIKNQDIFYYIYKKVTKETKIKLLDKLFEDNYDMLLKAIEGLRYNIPNKAALIDKMFDKIRSVTNANKLSTLNIINKMKCARDSGLREKLKNIIISYLKSSDKDLQEIGYLGFKGAMEHIGEERKRTISKEVFDWLHKVDVTDKYQSYAIQSILISYHDGFTDEEKKEFVHFIFDELIRKSTDINVIEFGFEVLKQIKPTYEDRKKNFDDIKVKIENTVDKNIKATLLEGLAKLKPKISRKTKASASYWEWLEEQKKE